MIGRTCAQYRILAKLGEGSMGIVYKAQHARLGHVVALKFLRPELVGDENRRARFLREAEIAASLDSPAVCPVIDFGEDADGNLFLVMRYCEGQTLRERLRTGPLPLARAVLFAIQVAEGLQNAHSHRVIHRDIKPSNIIIGSYRDGSGSSLPPEVDPDRGDDATLDMPHLIEQAKITDFGLAFLPENTRLTRSEAQLGTPAYMSPEQVRGREADPRSDIWGLGAVLYEMVTGSPPFGSANLQSVMNAILESEPAAVATLRPEAPPELGWIIGKSLRKDPDGRYQNVSEMLRDLRLLQERLSSGSTRDLGTWVVESRGRLLTFGGGLLAVAAVMLGWVLFRPDPAPRTPHLGRPNRVTTEIAWEGAPAISPEGSRIAYASDVAGNLDIYVVPLRGGTALRLTDDPAADSDPVWLPDGSAILFNSSRLPAGGIWKVGPHGGDAMLVAENASYPAVSPDGTRIAFSRAAPDGELRIFVAPLDDLGAAVQLTGPADGTFAHTEPAWSPDGTSICYATAHDLWLVAADGGDARPLTSDGIADSSPTWSPRGNQIYFASARENTLALWRVGLAGGPAERLTPGSGPESSPDLSRDGRTLAYTTGAEMVNDDVVIARRDDGSHVRLVGLDDAYQPVLAPGGDAVCYVSNRREGRRELWLQALVDGRPEGAARRLTDQSGTAAHPAFSPDGKWLAYYRIEGDQRSIWIAPVDGGAPHRFTDHGGESIQPAWSPDGTRLAFSSDRDGSLAIFACPVDRGRRAGAPVRLTPPEVPGVMPTWSPDGSRLAFVTTLDGRNQIWIVAADGSEECRGLRLDALVHMAHWDLASGRIWVSGVWPEGLAIRSVDPATGETAPLDPPFTFTESTSFAHFHADATGAIVVYSLPHLQGNIWTMEAAVGTF